MRILKLGSNTQRPSTITASLKRMKLKMMKLLIRLKIANSWIPNAGQSKKFEAVHFNNLL